MVRTKLLEWQEILIEIAEAKEIAGGHPLKIKGHKMKYSFIRQLCRLWLFEFETVFGLFTNWFPQGNVWS